MATGVGSALIMQHHQDRIMHKVFLVLRISNDKKSHGSIVYPVGCFCAQQYRPAFDKWNELVDKLNHERKQFRLRV